MIHCLSRTVLTLAFTVSIGMLHLSRSLALSHDNIKQRIEAAVTENPELSGTKVRIVVEDG